MFDLILQATLILLCVAAGGAGMALSIVAVFGSPYASKQVSVDHDANQKKRDEEFAPLPVERAARLSA